MNIEFNCVRASILPEGAESLDPLEVRVLVINDRRKFCALVQFDLKTVTTELYRSILRELEEKGVSSLNSDNMIVTATHTHTAPRPTPEYTGGIAKLAAAKIYDALCGLREGVLESTTAAEYTQSFNRRWWMEGGVVVSDPGKMNPAAIRPEGEIDPEIPILAIRETGGVSVVIADIANHAEIVGGKTFSADWPGFFRRSLESGLNGNGMVFPLIAPSGNVNPVDVRSPRVQAGIGEAERIGLVYAKAVKNMLPRLNRLPRGELVCRSRVLEFPEHDDAVLTSLDFGGAVILALPGEPFAEIGLELRHGVFSGKTCLIASHSNGGYPTGGYILNSWNFPRGGMETRDDSNPYPPETSARIVQSFR